MSDQRPLMQTAVAAALDGLSSRSGDSRVRNGWATATIHSVTGEGHWLADGSPYDPDDHPAGALIILTYIVLNPNQGATTP